MFNSKLCLFGVLCCVIIACKTPANKPLSIKFSADSTSIIVSNIGEAAVFQLKNNINKDTTYQNLVTVLETPAEDDSASVEREWPGKLNMKGNEVIFTPYRPFLKGKTYLVETKLNMSFGDIEHVLKGKMSTSMNFQQQLLKR